jgi:hypothetical protein
LASGWNDYGFYRASVGDCAFGLNDYCGVKMKVYFWTKMSRTTGNVGKGWQPSSTADNCDAMGSGLFGDSVTWVTSRSCDDTPNSIACCKSVFAKDFKMSAAYHNFDGLPLSVPITEREFRAYQRTRIRELLEAMGYTDKGIEAIEKGDSVAMVLMVDDCEEMELISMYSDILQTKVEQ